MHYTTTTNMEESRFKFKDLSKNKMKQTLRCVMIYGRYFFQSPGNQESYQNQDEHFDEKQKDPG